MADKTIDEGLNEIRDKHTERVFLRTYNKERWFFEEENWKEMQQAIKELFCSVRGCEHPKNITYPHGCPWLEIDRHVEYKPCIHCGKEAG